MQRTLITRLLQVRGKAFTIALAMAALLSGAVASHAQEYLTLPIDDHAKTSRSGAMAYLKDGVTTKDKFDEYFTKFYFPSMTRTEPEALGNLGKIREDFFKQILWKAPNPAAQLELTNMALGMLGKIVTAKDPSYHPQVRYNAILFIGMLDEQPSPDGRQLPKPLPKANQALTKIVDLATTDGSFPPAVILGAVIGLERHAIYRQSLPPDSVKAMSAALMKLVAHDAPIQDMNTSAYSWLRLRAASALTRMGTVGDKNAIHAAVIKLASTGKSIDDRCSAAAMLDRLEYKDVKLDDAGTAEPLFALARDVCADADKRAGEFQDQYSTSGGAVSSPFPNIGPEGYGSAPNPANEIEIYPRRQTLTRLIDLRTALKKVKPSLPAETQKKAEAVITALNAAITSAADKGTTPLALVESFRTMADAIKKAVPAAETAEEKATKEKEATNAF